MSQIEIPKGWELKKLHEIAEIGQGGTPSRSKNEYWNGTIPWLRSGELRNNRIKNSNEKITNVGLKNSSTKLCPKGTILMAMTGQGLTRGRTALLEIEACANQSCAHIINKNNDKLLTEFLWMFLQSKYWFIRSIHHGSGQPGINVSLIKQLEVPIPPLHIQKRIVRKLDYVLGQLEEKKKMIFGINNIKRLLILSQQQYHYMLTATFSGKLTESWRMNNDKNIESSRVLIEKIMKKRGLSIKTDEKKVNSQPMTIPKKWEWISIGTAFEIIMGQSPSGTSYNSNKIGIPLLNGPTEFTKVNPIPKQWTDSPTKICEKGDLLICVRGNTTGKMNWADQKYCIGRGLAAIHPVITELNSKLLSYFLSIKTNEILKKTTGSTFPNLSRDKLSEFLFPLPPLEEQQEMIRILESKINQLENIKEKIEHIKKSQQKIRTHFENLNNSILNNAFSGRLVN